MAFWNEKDCIWDFAGAARRMSTPWDELDKQSKK